MKLSGPLSLLGLVTATFAAFDGLGQPYSEPYCAWACRAVIGSANLTCTMAGHGGGSGGHDHSASMGVMTMPSCRANDDAFLTTLAYCIKTRCTNISVGEIEQYWVKQISGDPTVPPKWNYAVTLNHIDGTPNVTYASGRTINTTMLVSNTSWNIQNRWLPIKETNSHLMYKYTYV